MVDVQDDPQNTQRKYPSWIPQKRAYAINVASSAILTRNAVLSVIRSI
jgi:hypothetical protein